MRIVIEIDHPMAPPGEVAPPQLAQAADALALAPALSPAEQRAPVKTPGAIGEELDSALSAGAAPDAGPSAGDAPPDLLARAATLDAFNAGPAPDLSAPVHHPGGASTPASPVASDVQARACSLEAAHTGGISSAGAAPLN